MGEGKTSGIQSLGEARGVAVDPSCNLLEAFLSMPTGVQRAGYRKKHLRRTDIAGRLFTANVLLPRLQCQPVRAASGSVYRHTYQTAW